MKNILYINGCIRRHSSRTGRLAQAYLEKRSAQGDCRIQPLILENTVMAPLDEKSLEAREQAVLTQDFSGAMFDLARMFRDADEVVLAVPYWDLSFPAVLKLYVEQLCVNGLTFRYSEKGIPCGLTRITSVTYITTAGGYIGRNNFGFEYIKGVFRSLFSIEDIRFFSAEGLDIRGNDPEQILLNAMEQIRHG